MYLYTSPTQYHAYTFLSTNNCPSIDTFNNQLYTYLSCKQLKLVDCPSVVNDIPNHRRCQVLATRPVDFQCGCVLEVAVMVESAVVIACRRESSKFVSSTQ
eukprot:gene1298-4503_t